MASTLLTLPLELRLAIFESLGSATELRFGFSGVETAASKPQYPFAILQTCHQFSHEAKSPLWHNIHLIFANTTSFIKTLASLTQSQLESIRYITFHGTNFQFIHSCPNFGCLRWAEAIVLFPGLQLETLTVFDGNTWEDGWGGPDKWSDISLQSFDGMGWKTLNFITPKVRLLMQAQFRGSSTAAFPWYFWDGNLKKRDGDSASVRLWMVKTEFNGIEGAVLDPERREEVLDKDEHMFEYFTEENFVVCCPDEWDALPDREVMVSLCRGSGALYAALEENYSDSEKFVKEHGWDRIFKNCWLIEDDDYNHQEHGRYLGIVAKIAEDGGYSDNGEYTIPTFSRRKTSAGSDHISGRTPVSQEMGVRKY